MRLQAVLLSDMKKPHPFGWGFAASAVGEGSAQRSGSHLGEVGSLTGWAAAGEGSRSDAVKYFFRACTPRQRPKGDSDVGEHVRQIVQQGVEPGAVHSHAEEGLGHVFRPNGGAHHIVHQEAGKPAIRVPVNTPLLRRATRPARPRTVKATR